MPVFDASIFDAGSASRTITLLGLRQATLRRGGVENSTDLTALVLNDYANSAIAELYDLLVEKDDDRFVLQAALVTVVNVDSVQLPNGFYDLRLVEIVDASAQSGYRRLRPCAVEAKHLYSNSSLFCKRYRYWFNRYQLTLVPTPQTVETLRVYYIPSAPVLVDDTDTLDGFNGYEELVIEMMWRRCLVRRDLGTENVDREIERLIERVKTAADARDSEPFYLNPRGPGYDCDDEDYY